MKTKFCLAFFLLNCFIPIAIKGQTLEVYQPSQMHSDLIKFKLALQHAHPGLYTHLSPEEFESIFEGFLSKTGKPMTSIAFFKVVLQFIASFHDGHTRAFPVGELRSYVNGQKLMPFHCKVQNERIFIIRNLSQKNIKDGSEIISINGFPSNGIISTLTHYYSGDGLSKNVIYYRLGSSYNSFYRVFPLIFGFYPTYTLAIRDFESGKIEEAEVSSISFGDFRAIEKDRYGNYLHTVSMEEVLAEEAFIFTVNEEDQYAYMNINRFFKEDFYESKDIYPDFYKKAFQRIKEKRIPNLIIDLRGNGGGIGSNAAHLVQHLTNHSFIPTRKITLKGNDKYYLEITLDSLKLDEYFGLQPGPSDEYMVTRSDNIEELKQFPPIAENHFEGFVYVLIDGGTLSAAGMAAGLLQEHTDAIFIGQETGGYSGMSNGIRQLSILGDSTEIGINFPLLHSEFDVNEQVKKRGVVPDYVIHQSIHDVINGKDTILEFALTKIHEGRAIKD